MPAWAQAPGEPCPLSAHNSSGDGVWLRTISGPKARRPPPSGFPVPRVDKSLFRNPVEDMFVFCWFIFTPVPQIVLTMTPAGPPRPLSGLSPPERRRPRLCPRNASGIRLLPSLTAWTGCWVPCPHATPCFLCERPLSLPRCEMCRGHWPHTLDARGGLAGFRGQPRKELN